MQILYYVGSLLLLGINIGAFFLVIQDKSLARAQAGKEKRYSEGVFFLLAILGGSVGVYMAMLLARHKTQKVSFFVGIPLLFIQQILIAWLITQIW